jgi:peroxiredoxin
MTGRRRIQITAAIVLGVVVPCGATLWFFRTTIGRKPSIIGKDAPLFEATTTTGDVLTLSGYDGRRLALLFVDLDCPACVEQLGFLDGLNRESLYPDLGILAVSESGQERTAAFAGQISLSIPLGIDSGSVARGYQVDYEPTLILIDDNRIVRFYKRGGLAPDLMRRLISDFAVEGKIPLEAVVGGDPDE